MKNNPVKEKERFIDGTVYIVESTISKSATETVKNKLMRLMLNDTNLTQLKTAS